jgi:hypothetical protein|tara:strand:- start:138 stop:695 length:558 start_codon:yes stop_codon:yes gene_type:complete
MSALQSLPSNLSYLSPVSFKFAVGRYPAVNYFCQTANLPGVSISTIPFITPLKNVEDPGDEVMFEQLSIRMIIDENLQNWLSIWDWINVLGAPTDITSKEQGRRRTAGELKSEAILTVLTSNMNPQINIKFHDMWPVSLSGINFDSTLTDIEYATADVSFQYDVYEIQNLLNNETTFSGLPINRG